MSIDRYRHLHQQQMLLKQSALLTAPLYPNNRQPLFPLQPQQVQAQQANSMLSANRMKDYSSSSEISKSKASLMQQFTSRNQQRGYSSYSEDNIENYNFDQDAIQREEDLVDFLGSSISKMPPPPPAKPTAISNALQSAAAAAAASASSASSAQTASNSNLNSNPIRSLLTTTSASELQKQLFMPKFTSSASLQPSNSISDTFNFLTTSSVNQKSSQEILNELELKQFRLQKAQEKAKQAVLKEVIDDDNIKLSTSSRVSPGDLNLNFISKQISKGSNSSVFDVLSSDDSDNDFGGNETMKKQRRLNDEKRIQLKQSLNSVKNYYESLNKNNKVRSKEEEKAARARQELIEAAQQQQEKDRIESERRAQREKLLQIKRAEELRKKKKTQQLAPTQTLATTTLEYRNRLREELRNMNLDEELIGLKKTGESSSSATDGVLSIAPNQKRNNNGDFEFLAGDVADESIDAQNYYALLRFVFSQDFNRTDILRIENKRIPNKFSNWKEYFSIFEYLFLMECVASIQSAFASFRSHENYRQPLSCYVKQASDKENAHGFLELQVCRKGADLEDAAELSSQMEDDYYTLMSMRNHAVLISSTSDMKLSTLSNKINGADSPFLFFGWVMPPDKTDPKSVLKIYVDIDQSLFSSVFEESPLVQVSVFNFTKMTTFIREYLAIKNMRENNLNRFIYNPLHIIETKTAISNPQILVPLFEELRPKYNESQFQSIKEICLTSQGICMLQGPPGTGKTHTLLGLLSGLYYYIKKNPETTKPKIMICAPSNTAVDEIVSRIVDSGLHQPGGVTLRVNVVRMGAIDYVPQENVKRASLEYQIERIMQEKGIQQQPYGSKASQMQHEMLIDMRINVARLNQDIEKAKKELVGNELKDLLNSLYTKKRELKAKIAIQKLEKVARRDQIKQISDQILGLADVVCCTLTSSMSEKLERFKDQIEVLIVDEAAQCTEPNNIIPLFYQPNKMVLIGDPKQLPATTFQPDTNVTKYNRSLFERIIDNTIKPYFLDEQYRMHPDIRAFPSSAFYDNKLRDGQLVLSREFPKFVSKMEKHNVQFIDITFSKERCSNKSYENDAEAEAAIHICTAVFKQLLDSESPSIGIITPYKQQTKLINDMIRRYIEKSYWKYIQVNTVDSFQGQEKDIIIFTTVRAANSKERYRQRMIGFLQDERRMNVALTRARYCLFVLGHADTLNSNPTWGNYVDTMAASKRYGKLERRENLKEIGGFIVNGTLIDSERQSSVYVKKDWGEEYRLAQQVEKEQVNDLQLTDFETINAPIDADESTQDSSNASNSESKLRQAAAMEVEEPTHHSDQSNTIEHFDAETGGDATPKRFSNEPTPKNSSEAAQKRSGVSMQEAMERMQEEKVMREFGSGLQGLKSLLNKEKQVKNAKSFNSSGADHATSTSNTMVAAAAASNTCLSDQKQSTRNGNISTTCSNNNSMEEEISINLDAAEAHSSSFSLAGLVAPTHSSSSHQMKSYQQSQQQSQQQQQQQQSQQQQQQPQQPSKTQKLLMKSIFASEKERSSNNDDSQYNEIYNAYNTDSTPKPPVVDIYDQMRQQKQQSLMAKKAMTNDNGVLSKAKLEAFKLSTMQSSLSSTPSSMSTASTASLSSLLVADNKPVMNKQTSFTQYVRPANPIPSHDSNKPRSTNIQTSSQPKHVTSFLAKPMTTIQLKPFSGVNRPQQQQQQQSHQPKEVQNQNNFNPAPSMIIAKSSGSALLNSLFLKK